MLANSRAYLVDLVRRAFADSDYPDDDRIVYDNRAYHLECTEVREAFRGRHWRDVTDETLAVHSAALHFMTLEAQAYYLPAFLVYSLNTDFADSASETAISVLIPRADRQSLDRLGIASFADRLTTVQRRAICEFLERLMEENPDDVPFGTDMAEVRDAWCCGHTLS